MYTAKNIETGELITMTAEQARTEIISTYQQDMGVVFGEGKTDEEIATDITASNLEDYFDDGVFEGTTYEITRTQ